MIAFSPLIWLISISSLLGWSQAAPSPKPQPGDRHKDFNLPHQLARVKTHSRRDADHPYSIPHTARFGSHSDIENPALNTGWQSAKPQMPAYGDQSGQSIMGSSGHQTRNKSGERAQSFSNHQWSNDANIYDQYDQGAQVHPSENMSGGAMPFSYNTQDHHLLNSAPSPAWQYDSQTPLHPFSSFNERIGSVAPNFSVTINPSQIESNSSHGYNVSPAYLNPPPNDNFGQIDLPLGDGRLGDSHAYFTYPNDYLRDNFAQLNRRPEEHYRTSVSMHAQNPLQEPSYQEEIRTHEVQTSPYSLLHQIQHRKMNPQRRHEESTVSGTSSFQVPAALSKDSSLRMQALAEDYFANTHKSTNRKTVATSGSHLEATLPDLAGIPDDAGEDTKCAGMLNPRDMSDIVTIVQERNGMYSANIRAVFEDELTVKWARELRSRDEPRISHAIQYVFRNIPLTVGWTASLALAEVKSVLSMVKSVRKTLKNSRARTFDFLNNSGLTPDLAREIAHGDESVCTRILKTLKDDRMKPPHPQQWM